MPIEKINSPNDIYIKAGFKIPTFNYSSTPKIDKVDFKNNKTKKALTFVSISSLAVLGLIAFCSKKKIKPTPKMNENLDDIAQNIQENGSKIHQKMKKMANEVTYLFNKKPNKNNILEEFKDGILIRKSTFNRGIVSSIEEFQEKTSNLYEFDFNGNPILCSIGIEKLKDQTKIAQKYSYYYNSDCVEKYCENITKSIDGTKKILKKVFFNGLKLDEIQENVIE